MYTGLETLPIKHQVSEPFGHERWTIGEAERLKVFVTCAVSWVLNACLRTEQLMVTSIPGRSPRQVLMQPCIVFWLREKEMSWQPRNNSSKICIGDLGCSLSPEKVWLHGFWMKIFASALWEGTLMVAQFFLSIFFLVNLKRKIFRRWPWCSHPFVFLRKLLMQWRNMACIKCVPLYLAAHRQLLGHMSWSKFSRTTILNGWNLQLFIQYLHLLCPWSGKSCGLSMKIHDPKWTWRQMSGRYCGVLATDQRICLLKSGVVTLVWVSDGNQIAEKSWVWHTLFYCLTDDRSQTWRKISTDVPGKPVLLLHLLRAMKLICLVKPIGPLGSLPVVCSGPPILLMIAFLIVLTNLRLQNQFAKSQRRIKLKKAARLGAVCLAFCLGSQESLLWFWWCLFSCCWVVACTNESLQSFEWPGVTAPEWSVAQQCLITDT